MAEQRQKLCWNCEGNISFQEENCPFCAVYVGPIGQEIKNSPFRNNHAKNKDIPASPYAKEEVKEEAAVEEDSVSPAAFFTQESLFMPLVFLPAGSILLLFSIYMVLFSENGRLTLQWNADYWYIYFLLSLPMLGCGWWFLQGMRENDPE